MPFILLFLNVDLIPSLTFIFSLNLLLCVIKLYPFFSNNKPSFIHSIQDSYVAEIISSVFISVLDNKYNLEFFRYSYITCSVPKITLS